MGKTINTRIQLKSDTELNWRKSVLSIDNEMGTKENVEGARSFIPQKGEAIIFEPDNEHSFSRLKIGDGITNVLSLPFIDAGTTNGFIVRKEVPSDAEFTDTTYSSGSGITINNNTINHTNSITPSNNSEKKVYKITYDSEGHINDAEEISVGTVKSVQIQASSPLQSSVSTSQSESLNTTISFITQGKNTVLAGPTDSTTNTPSFRLLTEDDIPNLSASKITGTFLAEQIGNLPASKITSGVLNEDRIPNLGPGKISGIIPISKGGTGFDGINGDPEHNILGFYDNGIFAYDSENTRFKQFEITAPGNTDTFTSYINSLNKDTKSLIVNLSTLIKAIPPMNLNNPRDITENYINSYYAPRTKGWKNSVLISQGGENFNEGTEPLWLNPTALSAEGSHGGALFYGRDNTSTNLPKPFKTQWGTLPVEQGGTGVTNFDNNIDKVLITAINTNTNVQYFSTITKTSDSTANTLVLRDSNSNFAINTITISSGINTITSDNIADVIKIINNVPTHYGNLAADNLTATIGTIEMSKFSGNIPTDLPIINWYKSILNTRTKIGSIYWTVDNTNNGQASFVNISNEGNSEIYQLPAATSTTSKTYKILTTKNTLNGALYVSADETDPIWGTLPIAQGGTGVTTLSDLFNEIKGTGSDGLGDATWVNVTGDTITGQLILNRTTSLTSDTISNGALIIGRTTNAHLAFDTDSIMAKNNTDVSTLFINEFGGNVNILKASDANYSVNIRSTKSSTSSSTGALVVKGGLGIGGTIYGGSAIYAPSGNIWAGTDANTASERQVGVQSGAGQLYLFSQATTSGNRGLYIPAHGTGTAKDIITIDTNNNVNFYGTLSGHATSDLALSGGTMSGDIFFSNSGTTIRQIQGVVGDNDYWRIAGCATASNSGYMEIATADDGTEPIYVRQYTGVFSSVARTLTLLDALGNTTIPRMLLVASTGETSSYDQAAMQIREYNYANANTDTWGHAPRLAWHWSGRVAAQIGLGSDGYLYTAPVTGTNFYKLMYESGTWGINITGNAATATKATQDADGNTISSTYLKLSGGAMTGVLTAPWIELGHQVSGHGGSIDFHYNGSAADYTTRLIENSSGNLLLTGSLTIQNNGLWVQGGSEAGSNNSRMGLSAGMPDAFPYNTSKRGVKIYSNAIALADPYNGNSNSDAGWIRHLEETGNSGILEIGVGDDGNESIVARQYNTSSSIARTLTLLDASGNTFIPGILYWAPNTAYYWNGDAGYSSTYYTNNWFRSFNNTGWYNETYGGGIFMEDSTWVKVSHGKSFSIPGNLHVSSANTSGGGIILADDGDIVDLNDGYCSMRFSYGVNICSGNRSGSASISLKSNGEGIFSKITVNGPATDSDGAVKVNDTRTDGGWHYPFTGECANLPDGSNMYIHIGKQMGTGYGGGLRYYYVGANSNSNLLGFEFYGQGTKLWATADGNGGVSGSWSTKGYVNTNYGISTTNIITQSEVYGQSGLYTNGNVNMLYNGAWYPIVQNHGNGNTSLNATGGGIYQGHINTSEQYFYTNGTWRFRIDASGYCYTSSYLYLGGGNESNVVSPPVVWGLNGSDNYLRTYLTSSLNVNSANSANYLNANARMDYNWNGVNYFNLAAARNTGVKNNQTPYKTDTWTHILRFNHGNPYGYYTDLAIPFNANSIWYRRICGGGLPNATYNSNTGWVEVLDEINYTSFAAKSITFTSGMATIESVKAKLEELPEDRTVVFRSHSTPMTILSHDKVTNSGVGGLILRVDASQWRVIAFVGSSIWSWVITGFDTNANRCITTSVYKYTGTVQ